MPPPGEQDKKTRSLEDKKTRSLDDKKTKCLEDKKTRKLEDTKTRKQSDNSEFNDEPRVGQKFRVMTEFSTTAKDELPLFVVRL
jgi:hypothetical protein